MTRAAIPCESLRVIREDEHVIAIEKPAGLHSVSIGEGGGASLADLLLRERPELAAAGAKPGDAGLVQRLDYDTSGVILGAKDPAAWNTLRETMGEKTYLALVEGEFVEPRTVSNFLGSPYRGGKKVRVYPRLPGPPHRAQPALTHLQTVGYDPNHGVSLLRARLEAGRRHQVRVHAAHAGHPLLGDSLYGSKRSLTEILPAARRAFLLHAESVTFLHPANGQTMTIRSSIRFTLQDIARGDLGGEVV